MMYYQGFGFVGMFFMAAFWIGFILLIIWLIRQGIRHNGLGCCSHDDNNHHKKNNSERNDYGKSDSPMEILNRRLAEGEITEKEYDSLKKKLGY